MAIMAQARRPERSRIGGAIAEKAGTLLGAALLAALLLLPSAPGLAAEVVLPVPRITIYPGSVISEALLLERTFRGPDYERPVFAKTTEALVGKVARQTLLPNQPVPITGIREPFAVQQGQPAVVIFQAGGLIISATAIPLQAGAAGEVISLRNTDSGTTIRGVVQADGTVRVGLP